MKTEEYSALVYFPEIVGKTLKNVIKDGFSVILEFTDGSTFLAIPKPLPNTKYADFTGALGTFAGEEPILQAIFESDVPWNDPREPETDSVIIACRFTLYMQTYLREFRFTAYTSVTNIVQLDTKLTPASIN